MKAGDELLDYIKYDSLAGLLRRRLRMSHVQSFAITASVMMLPFIVGIALYGQAKLSLLFSVDMNRLRALLFSILNIPLLVYFYYWLPDCAFKLFHDIGDQMEPVDDGKYKSYDDFLRDVSDGLSSVFAAASSLIVSISLFIYWIYNINSLNLVITDVYLRAPALKLLGVISLAIAVYMGTISVIRLIILTVCMYIMYSNFNINIEMMHPDGAGGLGAIGRSFTLIMIILLVMFSSEIVPCIVDADLLKGMLASMESFMYYMLFLIIVPMLASAWVFRPRKMMLEKRNKLLNKISMKIDEILRSDIDNVMMVKSVEERKRIRELLLEEYNYILREYPILPVNRRALLGIMGIATVPYIITGMNVVLSLVDILT